MVNSCIKLILFLPSIAAEIAHFAEHGIAYPTGFYGVPAHAGFLGLTAHPNGAVVPLEPADVVAARQAHLAHFA